MAEPPTPSRLSNADFRSLLATPRAAEPATPSRFAKYDPNYVPVFKKPEAPSSGDRDKKKKKFHPKKVEEKKETASGYVDRASLRRDGKLADHDVEAEAVGSLNSYISPEELKNLTEAERRALEIERSKYLGGSETTTHLVKGLDYALLAKVKEDLSKKERETELQQRGEKAAPQEKLSASSYSKVISTEGHAHEVDAIDDFKTFIGKAVFDVIFRKPSETVDTFLPGRTSFVFDLDPDSMSDIPTIVKRSKDDLPVGRELMTSVVHPELFSKVQAIMVYLHQGAKAYKKLKKKEKREKEEKQQALQGSGGQSALVDDDNIYDTDMTGVYIPKVTALADDDRFDSRSASSRPAQGAVTARAVEEAEKARLAKLTARDNDGYAEAYPSAFEGMSYAVDDDDEGEGDLLKIDTRQNLKRHEFESDEAWIAHQTQREAIPKAAYQFGLKKKDGRDKKAFSEDKLKKQLRAVEDMIESKQGRKMSGFEDAAEEKQRKPRRHSEEDPYKTADVDNSSYEARLASKRKEREGQDEPGSATKKPRLDTSH